MKWSVHWQLLSRRRRIYEIERVSDEIPLGAEAMIRRDIRLATQKRFSFITRLTNLWQKITKKIGGSKKTTFRNKPP